MVHFNGKKLLIYSLLLLGMSFLMSCGEGETKRLLMNKKWEVYDVKPPEGTFNIENSKRAKQLKNGFYQGAWFKFLEDSLFVASFGGEIDTAKYALIAKDEIELYPSHGGKAYERLLILKINKDELNFDTEMADFKMTLFLKAVTYHE